jgi:hypothetical protein
MNLTKIPHYTLGLCVLLLCSTITYAVDCPRCSKDKVPMAGHGPAVDGSQRLNVNVQIAYNGTSSWTDPSTGQTNGNIWDGVQNAARDWNNATTSSGQPTKYHFNLNQGIPGSSVDVRIVQGTPGGGALAMTLATRNSDGSWGPPYKIVLPTAARNWSPAFLQSVIAHELGHTLGLAHAYRSFATCGHTIMNHTSASGARITALVQPQDVEMANKHYGNPSVCTGRYAQNTTLTGGAGFVDPQPFRYAPKCYYFYKQIPVYQLCDCISPGAPSGWKIVGYIYKLEDSVCF